MVGVARTSKAEREAPAPAATNWRTSDEDEINRRKRRAREEDFRITNVDAAHPVYSTFRVKSGSGLTYSVEVRDVEGRQFACDCVDFRSNGLGTCKHVEAVLLHLEGRLKKAFSAAVRAGSNRLDVVVEAATNSVRIKPGVAGLPRVWREYFEADGRLRYESAEEGLAKVRALAGAGVGALRVSQEVGPWLEELGRVAERRELRRHYEWKVQSGEWPVQETKVPLFPYQREGMLHLAFTERALLADEMGLGKTIQAVAACALLHRLGKAQRVLVVTPASLKTEWEEQIRRFTDLPYRLVFGSRRQRLAIYQEAPFFTVANYEQMVADALDVNEYHRPDVVVLDEAQRIKNWGTKTAQAVKRLRSRYAFVLTGTPIENRIDELHSLMDFLNPTVLGPLFRFNRDFYELDERGRPVGVRHLDRLHERVRPYLLRRRKLEVETELPARTDRNHFVPMSQAQQEVYAPHAQQVLRLVNLALRRPLTRQEQERLQRELAMMRMLCDTTYILDPEDRTCPKLAELEKVLEECRANEAKVIVFSEWERMLELVRDLCGRLGMGYAWHTGRVPQRRRRAEINAFKEDPACRVFLTTDAGATGLNLQNASVVINCDLPWNPAKLEQRIARAWRKQQSRPVTVVNLITENSIEHRMLETLAVKATVAESVLDRPGEVTSLKLRGGREAFAERLKQLVTVAPPPQGGEGAPVRRTLPADPGRAFVQLARERIDGALVACEERFPEAGEPSVLLVVVEQEAARWREALQGIHGEVYGSRRTEAEAPARLEVIDRATHEAVERLVAAGLLTRATRAARGLWPEGDGGVPVLSEEERARVRVLQDEAGHQLRLALVLGGAGFESEARGHVKGAMHAVGRAVAVAHRLPEPAVLEDVLRPPLARVWPGEVTAGAAWVGAEGADWRPVAEGLQEVLKRGVYAG